MFRPGGPQNPPTNPPIADGLLPPDVIPTFPEDDWGRREGAGNPERSRSLKPQSWLVVF